MAKSAYTKYKAVIEKMGFRQLDVYRYPNREVLRIQRLSDGKVFVIELPKRRDEMSLEEFEKVVRASLSKKRS